MSLVFKCVAPCSRTAFIAVSGERVIGHICKELLEEGGFRWSWRLDVGEPTAPTAVSGFADDRESAEAALTDHWARWLADARLREG